MKTLCKIGFLALLAVCLLSLVSCGHGHDLSLSGWIVDQEATCTATGKRHIECTTCNTVIFSEEIALAAHTPGEWVVDKEATRTEVGAKHQSCSVCKAELQTEEIPVIAPMNSELLAQYVQARTVRLIVNNSSYGSGFFIDETGTLITNFHVVENLFYGDTPTLVVELPNGAKYDLDYVVKFDYAYDLAVLKIDVGEAKVPYLELATEEAVVGSKTYVCGATLGDIPGNFTDGQISSLSYKYGLADAYVSSAPASPGNSGGPVVNAYGEVVAITTAGRIDPNAQNVNIVVKTSNLAKLRFTGDKNLSEFVQWHTFEIRESFYSCAIKKTEESTTVVAQIPSYLHTYHTVTDATCKYSSNTYLASSGVNGYDSTKWYYTYSYRMNEYTEYVEYLKAEGYVYEEAVGGDLGDGAFGDLYYNELTGDFIEAIIYTDRDAGERVVQICMYFYTSAES